MSSDSHNAPVWKPADAAQAAALQKNLHTTLHSISGNLASQKPSFLKRIEFAVGAVHRRSAPGLSYVCKSAEALTSLREEAAWQLGIGGGRALPEHRSSHGPVKRHITGLDCGS